MRIALLNLPIDNNYGGNLQRYALMKVLQDMGHDVTHVQLRYREKLKWYMVSLVYAKRILLRYIMRKPTVINQELKSNELYRGRLKAILPFYEKYIKHTDICFDASEIRKLTEGKYDAFIVGSDQCWRKDMNVLIGWKTFLFDFLKYDRIKRIAYGVSFGKETSTYNEFEKKEFRSLYEKFKAASVREKSGLQILGDMGCTKPIPMQVLDPTFLLDREDYIQLIRNEKSPSPAKGKVFCYVLDMTEQIEKKAQEKASELQTEVVNYGIYGGEQLSIEMWLKSIYEASYVMTDSYHGTVFSILFHKPFIFCGNERRGNDRITSLFQILCENNKFDYEILDEKLIELRAKSLSFLSESLSL